MKKAMTIGMMRRKRMIGTKRRNFSASYNNQIQFQEIITGKKCPSDSVDEFSYHVQAMVEEMGEVMKADKRWKTHRNHRYEPEEKLDEIADVFITAMNLAIHSGFSDEEVEEAISKKISENYARLISKDCVACQEEETTK